MQAYIQIDRYLFRNNKPKIQKYVDVMLKNFINIKNANKF